MGQMPSPILTSFLSEPAMDSVRSRTTWTKSLFWIEGKFITKVLRSWRCL